MIELKSYKRVRMGGGETQAFTATIYIDGKKAGYVDNSGNGGCNSYWFKTPELRKEFEKAAEVFAAKYGIDFERTDAYTEHLALMYDWKKSAVKHEKKGFPVTLMGCRGEEYNGRWSENVFIGVKNTTPELLSSITDRYKLSRLVTMEEYFGK